MALTRHKQATQKGNPIRREHPYMESAQHEVRPARSLCDAQSMSALSSFECCGLIGLLFHPDSEEDAHPNISQGTHGNGMTFPFSSFTQVIRLGPASLAQALESKLLQGVAQGFDATQSPMSFGIGAALIKDRRSPSQCLQRTGGSIAIPILAYFCEHS